MNDSTLHEMVAIKLNNPATTNGIHLLKPQTLYYYYFDLLIVNLSYFWIVYSQIIGLNNVFQFVTFFLCLNATWLLATCLPYNYPFWGRSTYVQITSRLFSLLLSHAALLIAMSYLFFDSKIAFQSIMHSTLFLIAFLTTSRPFLHFIIQKSIKPFRYILIGGKNAHFTSIKKAFYKAFLGKAICVGRFGNIPTKKVQNLGIDKDIINYLQLSPNIERVVYIDSELNNKEIQNLMKVCSSKFIDFVVVPRESDIFLKRANLEDFYDLPILSQQKGKIAQVHYQVLKRLFDIIFSSLVIIFILSWMIPIFAILIKLESEGPVFFVQRRTGYFNSTFPCIKFRSMTVNDECNEKQATRSDDRITKIGAFLRRTNFDEFPQFINVLLGHMSVVGPRPHMLKHTRQYATVISEFMVRHSVMPGITGWAQANGHRGPTRTVEQMRARVDHDIWYIENWSFFLDLKCIFMTVINFLKGEENAF